MQLEPGIVITALAALAFYFRLIRLQKKRARNEPSQRRVSLIRRWPAAAAGIALAMLGAYMAAPGYFPVAAQNYWWVPVTLGFLVFQLAV